MAGSGEPSRRRLTPNLIALAVIVAITAVALAVVRPWSAPESDEATPRQDNAAAVLTSRIQDLSRATSLAEFTAAAGDSEAARTWATEVWQNLELLEAADVELRFESGGDSDVYPSGAVGARTQVTWRPGDASGLTDTPTVDATVDLIFDPVGTDDYAVRDAQQDSGPMPLWMAGELSIDESDGARVIAIDGGQNPDALASKAAEAYQTVQSTVPGADDSLVIFAPATTEQAAALLGQPAAAVTQLAGVTATVDGSAREKAATAIVLNPTVFSAMDERAAQVVVTHEATHQMTDANLAGVENWIAEGFADFVALQDDDAPLSVSAGQILASVRTEGPPDALPTRDDFDSSQHGLGGTYEAAWMIFRMLGERFDVEDIVDFYLDTLDGADLDESLETYFGLTIAELTARWQDYLVSSTTS